MESFFEGLQVVCVCQKQSASWNAHNDVRMERRKKRDGRVDGLKAVQQIQVRMFGDLTLNPCKWEI